MAYSNITSVDITISDTVLSSAGFGTPIFLSAHQVADDRVLEYTSTDEMLDDGFTSDDNAYKAAVMFMANSPSVDEFMIGRLDATVSAVPTNVSSSSNETYVINVYHLNSATTFTASYTHDYSSDDAQTICAELQSQLSGGDAADYLTITTSGTGSSASIDFESIDADQTFQVTASVTDADTGSFVVNDPVINGSAATNLAAIREDNDDFYAVTCETNPSDNFTFCQGLSTAIEDMDKLYFFSTFLSEDLEADDTSASLAYYCEENGRDNTIAIFHQYALSDTSGEAFPECYIAGYNLPYDAGSVTWCNLTVDLPASTRPANTSKVLSTTQKGTLMGINCNFVEKDSGDKVFRTGQVTSGEWIDVIRGVHWLTSALGTALKSLLINQKGGKVPYNNNGIARVRQVAKSVLQRAVNRGFLDSYTLTVPLVTDVSTSDWVNRVLSGVSFTGILAGAIHILEISGTVTTPSSDDDE